MAKLGCIGSVLLLVLLGLTACGDNHGQTADTTKNSKTKLVIGTTALTPGISEESEDKAKDGGLQGMDIDIIKEVAKRNNWEIEWKVADVQALFGMLDNGNIVTIANSIAINKSRAEKYNFDDPYAFGSYSFVSKQGSEPLNSIESLKGKKVAALASGDQKLSLDEINTKYDLHMEILPIDNNGAVLQSMLNGTADLAFIGTSAAALANKTLNLNLQIYDPGVRNFKLIHPFLKTPASDKIREAINKTIHDMRDDGTLKAISMKWFGQDLTITK